MIYRIKALCHHFHIENYFHSFHLGKASENTPVFFSPFASSCAKGPFSLSALKTSDKIYYDLVSFLLSQSARGSQIACKWDDEGW